MKSLIIIGVSGVGKGTIAKRLLEKNPYLEFVVSYTTRSPRKGQVNGKDYYFVSHHEFNEKLKKGEMLEHKKVFKNHYGTSKQSYMSIIEKNKVPLLDIDFEGMMDIRTYVQKRKQLDSSWGLPEVLCIMPPSWQVLQERLKGRKTQSKEQVQRRMKENRQQLQKMMRIRGSDVNFITNYQYQLTVYGIQRHLLKVFGK